MGCAMTLLSLCILSSCAAERRQLLKTSSTPPWVFRVTASQGDQAQCTATKDQQAYVSLYVACVTLDRSGYINIHYRVGLTVQATQPIPQVLDFGDINCVMAINGRDVAPVMVGDLGPVPSNGLSYSCTTNIRVNGVVTGNTQGPVGSVTWP